jgi:hypothetical protein
VVADALTPGFAGKSGSKKLKGATVKSTRTLLATLLIGLSHTIAAVAILLGFAGAPSARAQADCKVVFDATDKLLTTPYHLYMTRPGFTKDAKPQTDELISVGGAHYVFSRGAWKKSPMSIEDLQKQVQENRKNAKNMACSHVRDEAVNGEAAAVYKAHAETEDMKSDALVWISRSKGLILRQEEDLDDSGEKRHMSLRYEYTNVSAPAAR